MIPVFRFLFKDRSLWFKLSVMTVLPLLIAVALLIPTIARSLHDSMERRARTTAEMIVRLAGASISSADVVQNNALLQGFLDNLVSRQNIIFAAVVRAADGVILAHSGSRLGERLNGSLEELVSAASSKTGAPTEEIEVIIHPLMIDRERYADLVIGYSRAAAHRDAVLFSVEALFVAAAAAMLGILMAIGLAELLSRPVKLIALQAQRMGSGDLQQTITYDGKDALGQLARSFNEMVSNLYDRRAELMTIINISEKLHQSLDREKVISQAVDLLADYSGSPSVEAFILDQSAGMLRLVHQRGFGGETLRISSTLPVEGTLTGMAVKEKDLVSSTDITRDERVNEEMRQALMKDGFRGGIICLPLIFEDRILGVVNFVYKEPYALPEGKRATYLAIGRTIAMALANAEYVARIKKEMSERIRAEDALKRSVQEMSTLNALARNAGRSLSVDQVVEAVIDSLQSRLKSDALLFYLLEGDELILKGMYAREISLNREDLEKHALGECLCGISTKTGSSVFSLDIHSDPRCSRTECRDAGLRSFAGLPLLSGDKVIGLIGLGSCEEYDYSKEASFLETVSRHAAICLVNAMLYEQIKGQTADLERRVSERTAELEVAMQKAREADFIKSAFLASMSHELRTPLNSIIGFTGLLLQGLPGPLNDEQSKQMGMVQRSARHLLSLINEVLDLSKIEAGQLELCCETFDLPEAYRSVVQIISPMAEKKGLSMLMEIAPGIGSITSDRRRVEQVLINLLNNAVKFTDQGGVRIKCRSEESRIVTTVTDTGIGIRSEDLGSVFDAFRQIHNGVARRYEGTGLGLSICKKLIGMLGGEIRAESLGEGMGSAFTFTLPIDFWSDRE